MQTEPRAPLGVDRASARRAAICLLAALPGVLATGAAVADAGATDAGADVSAGAPYNLAEVVVTSRRREETLQDVPLAETVRTGADLEQQSAVLFEDAVQGVPNTLAFKSARSVSALEITMRGQTAIPSSIVYDPAVGLYINGVYVAEGQAAMGTLLDIDNVEIVRGTQGTLFGRNNTGGSVSIHTRAPQLDSYSGEFALAGGNDGLFGARAIVNVPITSTLAVRFAYQDNQHQGWGSSLVTGQNNFMDQHRYQARGSLLWQPGADFAAEVTYERFRANEAGALLHPLPGTLAAMIPGDTVPQDFYQTDAGKLQSDFAVTNAWGLNLSEHFSDALQAKLIAGYRELFADNDYDADAMAASIADVTLNNTSYQKSVELQLSGKLLADRFDWVGGLYWFHDHGAADSMLAPGLSSPLPTYDINSVDNRSKAAYLHGEYKLTDAWHVAGGARRTEDERALDDNAYVDTSPLPPGQFCTIVDASDPNNPIPIGAETGGRVPADPQVRHLPLLVVGAQHRLSLQPRPDGLPARRPRPALGRLEHPDQHAAGPAVQARAADGRGARRQGERAQQSPDAHRGRLHRRLRQHAAPARAADRQHPDDARHQRRQGARERRGDRGGTGGDAAAAAAGVLRLHLGAVPAVHRPAGPGPEPQRLLHDAQVRRGGLGDLHRAAVARQPAAARRLRLAQRARVQRHQRLQPPGLGGPAERTRCAHLVGGALEATLFGTNLTDKRYAYTGGTIVDPGTIPVASWQAAADRRLYGIEVAYRFSKPL